MDTEKATELIKHFKKHGISLDPENGLQHVLDYQDVIGRATPQEIIDFEGKLEVGGEKRDFIWVNFHALDQDTAVQIIKNTVVRRFIEKDSDALYDMFNEKSRELNEESKKLCDAKKFVYKKIRTLETEKMRMESRLRRMERELEVSRDINRELRGKAEEHRIKARKFDNIKELLS